MENNCNNTGNIEITVEELIVKGVTIRGLKATATSSVTDGTVRVTTDAAMNLVNKFIDTFAKELIADAHKRQDREEREAAARIKRDEALAAESNARRKGIELETKKLEKEIAKIK